MLSSIVLSLALSGVGFGHHGGYASGQCPTPQCPTKCPPAPSKCAPAPCAPAKCLPAPTKHCPAPSKQCPAPPAKCAPVVPSKQWAPSIQAAPQM